MRNDDERERGRDGRGNRAELEGDGAAVRILRMYNASGGHCSDKLRCASVAQSFGCFNSLVRSAWNRNDCRSTVSGTVNNNVQSDDNV